MEDFAEPFSEEKKEIQPPVKIDPSALTVEALNNIFISFILRDGTDYGSQELSLDVKIANLKRKLEKKRYFASV